MNLTCQQCGAALDVGLIDKTTVCPWCGSGNVVQRPPRPGIPPPSFIVGFSLSADEVKMRVAQWARSASWFAPHAFRRLQVELLKPVYAPAYLVSGVGKGTWRARSGYRYSETYREGGKTRTRTATEWHTLGQPFALRVSDLLISASQRISNDELEALEPFDLGRLARYSDAALVGWPAEEAVRSPDAMDAPLMAEVERALEPRIRALVPGEEVKSFAYDLTLADATFATVLIPVWTMMVRWSPTRARTRVLVNGQTGEVTGKVPTSAVKVTLAVLTCLALVLFLLKHGVAR